MENKPTFGDSVKAGLFGMIKGAAILGAIGLVVGSGIGLALGAAGIAEGGALLAAGFGAAAMAEMGVFIGGLIGAFTGVAQSRDKAIDQQDVINLSNIAFAQGVEAGRSQSVSQEAKQELKEAATNFQARLSAEQSSARPSITR